MNISEVSKKYDLSTDTLRYYEKIGLVKVERQDNGFRNYTERECKRIEFIKCMRNAGLSIEFLIKYISLFEQGDKTIPKRIAILEEQRSILIEKLRDMQETLNRLDHKITGYAQVLKAEKNMKEGK